MFKFSKKFLSLIMAILMLTMTAIGVNAEELITGTTDLLVDIGIIEGLHIGELQPLSANSCMTNAQADAAAAALGYTRVANEYSHGSPIYYNKKGNPRYITPDNTGHLDGAVWKGASTIDNLASKETRSGTYDAELNKIGP